MAKPGLNSTSPWNGAVESIARSKAGPGRKSNAGAGGGRQKGEGRGENDEGGRGKDEGGGQGAEGGKAEGRRREAEGKRQRARGRREKAEIAALGTDDAFGQRLGVEFDVFGVRGPGGRYFIDFTLIWSDLA
jgi:hypothetical protein